MDSKEQNNSSGASSPSDPSGLEPVGGDGGGDGGSGGSGGQGAPSIYDLVPADGQGGVGGAAPVEALPKGRKIESEKTTEGKRGKVGDSGLLDDFDEDADFSVDPQVEEALFGGVKSGRGGKKDWNAVGQEGEKLQGPAFVKDGFGTAEQLGWAAGGVLLAAIITTCLTADSRGRVWFADGIVTAYGTLLHTVTGVLAVFIGSYVAQRPLGNLVLAAARMGLAVCVLQLIFHLNIPPAGRFDETFLAIAGYCGVLWGLFRFKRDELLVVVCAHASMWMALWLSGVLYAWSAATIVKPTP